MMDDGEVDSPSSGGGLFDLQPEPYSQFFEESSIIQNDWDTLIGTQICSHTHICNPATGPDNTHTHTCEHTHTHTKSSGDEEKLTKKRRPSGNKEAVRKYREKQKAVKVNLEVRNAELEKENQIIPQLQKENLRLRRKLQEQSPRQDAFQHLYTENKRLRALLSQVRRSIDSELEGLNYPKSLFTSPAKVDRVYHPSGAGCAVPVPCFPARPVAHHGTGGPTDGISEEESLGWHTECELVGNTVTVCRSPRALEDAHNRTEECTSSDPTSNKKLISPVVRSSKAASTARSHDNINLSSATTKTAGVVPYQQHTGVVPCPATTPLLPCFNKATRQAASPQIRQAQLHNCIERWQEGCDLSCGDIEMTTDSDPRSGSLSPPDNVLQNAGTLMLQPKQVSLSKKSHVAASNPADLFSPGCLYANDGTAGEDCWDQQSLTIKGWLDQCDIVEGVCNAPMLNAAQDSSFRSSDETPGHSSRSSAPALPPRICNH